MGNTIPTLAVFAVTLTATLLGAAPGAQADQGVLAAPMIVEVHPDPVGDDRGQEWIELYNPLPTELSLEGWTLTDHDACFAPGQGYVGTYHWPLSGSLAPGEHRAVVLPVACLDLANGGDTLTVFGPHGQAVDSVAYGDEGDAPAPSTGLSLSACPEAPLVHAGWQVADPSPGEPNVGC